ncbi:hypothetical protein DFH27DRAFT_484564 [Peziza echinospora]|nr:hypothetical protein DFH27DRAFT_484564 [Peziza echinospora]
MLRVYLVVASHPSYRSSFFSTGTRGYRNVLYFQETRSTEISFHDYKSLLTFSVVVTSFHIYLLAVAMPWPPHVIRAFEIASQNGSTIEAEYYLPYNYLLMHLFPPEEGFLVHPQHPRRDDEGRLNYVNFTIIFVILYPQKPVLFLEVKPGDFIRSRPARRGADRQMRGRFSDFIESVEIPTIYGLSAIGTNLCIYTQDRETGYIQPELILGDRDYSIDIAPANRWNLDVLTPQGEEQLRNVATHVKNMCA